MLTKENGPFMVLAYTFRGPDAPRQALALVLELREKYHLPAYILLPKKFPGRSMIRGVPPQAPTVRHRRTTWACPSCSGPSTRPPSWSATRRPPRTPST